MTKPARVTLATVRRLALGFPGVEEGLSYGTPGFRVRGKFLARLREDGNTLVVKCGDDERDFRMKADPKTFSLPSITVDIRRSWCGWTW